jgi:hypothetical protein
VKQRSFAGESKFFIIIALAKETVKFAHKEKGLQGQDQTMPTFPHYITYVHSILCSDVIEDRDRNHRTVSAAFAFDVSLPLSPPTVSYISVSPFLSSYNFLSHSNICLSSSPYVSCHWFQ